VSYFYSKFLTRLSISGFYSINGYYKSYYNIIGYGFGVCFLNLSNISYTLSYFYDVLFIKSFISYYYFSFLLGILGAGGGD
jgi:hypothetical protein